MKSCFEALETTVTGSLKDDLESIVQDPGASIIGEHDIFTVNVDNPAKIPIIIKRIQKHQQFIVSDIKHDTINC